ncbi:ferrochelatase [Thiohalomonas denitrificans]|uniref:Ferrochelatase n=1 Tax=Thiohalomonas denitrificans TaxID=415747 RepID=A0A1G5PL82_9GAMM|nr:ferrochelatase [Thiohalomonas denitrificans]
MLGILVTNLGTPDAPTPKALRRYLAEFLWDRRVVDVPRPLWWLILNGFILRTRPRRSAASYRKVWTEEGSPLMAISRRQTDKIRTELSARLRREVPVVLGMRYGNPSIAKALEELHGQGVDRLLVLPLYPQYSGSTTASTLDAIAAAVRRQRDVPGLRFIRDYHTDSGYLDAMAASILEAREGRPAAQRLLFSFHGTPLRFRSEGDPYYQQCLTTARGIAERLALKSAEWQVVFQSRFGREEWLRPYADETLVRLPGEGIKSVDVVCPGFSADCLETLEEIAEENRHLFLSAGGESYHYIPALNDRSDHIKALAGLIERNVCSWLD